MAKIDQLLAAHPIRQNPYDKLEFAGRNHHKIPLYRVRGCEKLPAGAPEALARAFAKYGGQCFYCPTKFDPQLFSPGKAHRDHVLATSLGGSDLLHNLVIACQACGREKANDPIHYFKPKAAKKYLIALDKHIERCIKDAEPGPI
jgi:5-methylcytosine-specific restriction endonuclease McrA